jgi:lycopene beta-cyclase
MTWRQPGGYEHAIVGAGVSGLLLAMRLLGDSRSHSGPRILLVDPRGADDRRCTLAFWTVGPTPLDQWVLGEWDQLRVIGHDDRIRNLALADYRYRAIGWETARSDILAHLRTDPRVTILEAAVDDVRDGQHVAAVQVDRQWIPARWVYDSRPRPVGSPGHGHRPPGRWVRQVLTLHQTFRGVWVHSAGARVDPSAATLLDFSADDGPELGFAYVLPVDEHRAMVMAVRMGPTHELPDPVPAIPLELGVDGWQVVAEERGDTVLRTPALPRREGRRILAIGSRGGRVRASTGYAVMRMIADAQAITASLRQHGHPFGMPGDPWQDRALDAVWLHALQRERAALEPAFLALFSGVPIEVVLRFLDGRASVPDHLRVVAALPPAPFLTAAGRLALGRVAPRAVATGPVPD